MNIKKDENLCNKVKSFVLAGEKGNREIDRSYHHDFYIPLCLGLSAPLSLLKYSVILVNVKQ